MIRQNPNSTTHIIPSLTKIKKTHQKIPKQHYLNRGTKEDSCKQSLQLLVNKQTIHKHTHIETQSNNEKAKQLRNQTLM